MNHFLFILSLLPAVVLLWLFISSDRYPEPAGTLIVTFVLGMGTVAAIFLLSPLLFFFESLIPTGNVFISGPLNAFLTAAIPEELLKFAVVFWFCMRRRSFDEPMDGIVYGVTAALGFATLENILYVMDGGYSVAISRAFTAVPHHAMDGAIMGYFVGRYKFSLGNRGVLLTKALLYPILFHGFYDAPLLIFKQADTLKASIDAPYGLLLNIFFFAVVTAQIRYAARLTSTMRKEQDGAAIPTMCDTEIVIPWRFLGRLKRRLTKGVEESINSSTMGMELLYALLCYVGFLFTMTSDLLSKNGIFVRPLVAIVFLLYGIRYLAKAYGNMIQSMSPANRARKTARASQAAPEPEPTDIPEEAEPISAPSLMDRLRGPFALVNGLSAIFCFSVVFVVEDLTRLAIFYLLTLACMFAAHAIITSGRMLHRFRTGSQGTANTEEEECEHS